MAATDPARWQLAQLNIARLVAPYDAPELADFVANLARIYGLAEASEGFVWRMAHEDRDAVAAHYGADIVTNLSVWESLAALQRFVVSADHLAMMRRRREWFVPLTEANLVLWWVPAGHRPDLDEAALRLASLRRDGPTAFAFHPRQAFAPPMRLAGGSRVAVQ